MGYKAPHIVYAFLVVWDLLLF